MPGMAPPWVGPFREQAFRQVYQNLKDPIHRQREQKDKCLAVSEIRINMPMLDTDIRYTYGVDWLLEDQHYRARRRATDPIAFGGGV